MVADIVRPGWMVSRLKHLASAFRYAPDLTSICRLVPMRDKLAVLWHGIGGANTGMNELDISIVMPCLNERVSLPHCIANAQTALVQMEQRFGLTGEIVVADNGSTDGSQALSRSLGARVVDVAERGYGAALIGGFSQAHGRFLVKGDADGSYDFTARPFERNSFLMGLG